MNQYSFFDSGDDAGALDSRTSFSAGLVPLVQVPSPVSAPYSMYQGYSPETEDFDKEFSSSGMGYFAGGTSEPPSTHAASGAADGYYQQLENEKNESQRKIQELQERKKFLRRQIEQSNYGIATHSAAATVSSSSVPEEQPAFIPDDAGALSYLNFEDEHSETDEPDALAEYVKKSTTRSFQQQSSTSPARPLSGRYEQPYTQMVSQRPAEQAAPALSVPSEYDYAAHDSVGEIGERLRNISISPGVASHSDCSTGSGSEMSMYSSYANQEPQQQEYAKYGGESENEGREQELQYQSYQQYQQQLQQQRIQQQQQQQQMQQQQQQMQQQQQQQQQQMQQYQMQQILENKLSQEQQQQQQLQLQDRQQMLSSQQEEYQRQNQQVSLQQQCNIEQKIDLSSQLPQIKEPQTKQQQQVSMAESNSTKVVYDVDAVYGFVPLEQYNKDGSWRDALFDFYQSEKEHIEILSALNQVYTIGMKTIFQYETASYDMKVYLFSLKFYYSSVFVSFLLFFFFFFFFFFLFSFFFSFFFVS